MDKLATKTALRDIDDTLKSFPEKLDDAYEDILERIFHHQDKDSVFLATRVLIWLSYAKRTLTIRELQYALAVREDDVSFSQRGLIDPSLFESVCLGLVVIDHASNTVHFIHKTFQDYYAKVRSDQFLEAQVYISSICITYLSFDNWNHTPFADRTPFFHYAACYWTSHASGAPEKTLLQETTNLLELPSKLWYL